MIIASVELIREAVHVSEFNSLWPHDAMARKIWVNIELGNGLLPDGTKPLLQPMLTNNLWDLVIFIWRQFP